MSKITKRVMLIRWLAFILTLPATLLSLVAYLLHGVAELYVRSISWLLDAVERRLK